MRQNLPLLFIGLSLIVALAGMGFGMYMAGTQDHLLAPAHAHNNLVGFVMLFLFGLYYGVYPSAAAGRLPLIHFWLSAFSAVTIGLGIAMTINGQGEVLAIVSSLAAMLATIVFVVIVYQNRAAMRV
jgi:phosphatidylglycerophosphate synthase